METEAFLTLMARNWGWMLLRGVAAIIFGVLAFAWPGLTLIVLAIFWGAWALTDGIFALIAAFRVRENGRSYWPLILIGVLGIAAGVVTFFLPGLTALVLLMFIAAWAIVMGVLQIVAAIRLRKEIQGEWLLGLSGLVSLIFGVLMIARPGAGALAVMWLIAAWSIVFGVLMVALAFRLRAIAHGSAPRMTGTPRTA